MSELKKLKAEHKILHSLTSSKGWEHLKESIIKDEVLKVASSLCENKPMDVDQIHFQRGAMWAARRFSSLPDQLMHTLENDIALLEAQASLLTTPEPI